MPTMSLEYDKETEALLEDLKGFFGVKTKAAVVRRALALARVARSFSGEDHSLTMVEPGTGERTSIFVTK